MKRYVLWLWIVLGVGTAGAGGALQLQPRSVFDYPFFLRFGLDAPAADWLQYLTENRGFPNPGSSPRLQLSNRLLSGVGLQSGSIAEVTITPPAPKPSDAVSMTVSGEKPYYVEVDRAEYRVTAGGQVSVTVYWVDTRLIPGGSGFGLADEPYQITVPLGTFDPGKHMVLLSYRGAMTKSTTAHFTVVP